MSKPREGHGDAYKHIAANKSLKEILETAAAFEQSAVEFYTALIPKVGKNLRYLVEELAVEEKTHVARFAELAANPDAEAFVQGVIAPPEEDHRFSDYVHTPDLGPSPDDQTVLQYALGREDAAMKQYRALADTTAPGPVHDLFVLLANEETHHKRELEKRYYELIHRNPTG